MAKHYFYLEPGAKKGTFSKLVDLSSIENTGTNGRWKRGAVQNSWTGLVVPHKKTVNANKKMDNLSFTSYDYDLSFTCESAVLEGMTGFNDCIPTVNINSFLNDVDNDVKYLAIENGNLYLYEHKKREYSAKVKHWYFKDKNILEHIGSFLFGLESAGESVTNYAINENTMVSQLESGWNSAGWEATVELRFTKKLLASKGEYDIGADYSGSNIEDNYCFYCRDNNTTFRLSYVTSYPYTTIDRDSERVHSCSKHNATPVTPETTTSNDNNYNDNSTVSRNTAYVNKATLDKSSLGNVEKLAYGSVGDYKDGVARTPMIMVELRPNEKSDKGFNISIPANSLVSLTHERNMADSYNTFVLQIFDKDAMQVEAKLLLGFRYILFYYTDFVATSKRFKGEVLDYKTTITGKGIMLSLSGYSSNVNTYIGKDSIPWSVMCEANYPGFYYWMNEAGEYHGEVRIASNSDLYEEVFCSSEGDIVNVNAFPDISSIGEYSLKETSEDGQSKRWTTFRKFYEEKGATEADIDRFEPKPHLFTLATEGYNASLENVLADDSKFQLSDKRPSDIVKLICIINRWSYVIKDTKKVSEIPDQISMSYVEYIKEKLIPISVSDEGKSNTQYYFWFDDSGVAHYEPYSPSEDGIKKLYFNSSEHKDSYPLIGFTSATNGSVLMVTDATNTMEAINAYTGDPLSLSSVDSTSVDSSYLSTVIETSEWYSTNKLTVNSDDRYKLISYSNVSSLPSETELKNQFLNTWERISKYTYKASLDVYGCADISPGNYIDVFIYMDNGYRSSEDKDVVSEYWKNQEKEYNDSITYNEDGTYNAKLMYWDEDKHYTTVNPAMHHTSGRYIVNKITDTISAGKYMSSLEVLKIDKNKLVDVVTYNSETETESKTTVSSGYSSGGGGGSSFGGGGGGGSR